MYSVSYQPIPEPVAEPAAEPEIAREAEPRRANLGGRAISLTLTLIAHLLLLLLLLRLAPPFAKMSPPHGSLVTFSVAPDAQQDTARSRSAAKPRHAPAAPPAAVPPPIVKLPPVVEPWVLTPGLEKFDVRQVPQIPKTQQSSDASVADESNGAGDSDRPVAYGPGGQPLYDAQWYREPTDAQLAFYLKGARPGPGFGLIGCQTVARYHVDNCIELGETPGSGLARAVREAAWQFLVLPPRIGGRMQVGAWVRIRIDYSERKDR